jgi:CubicO group peptidase (beta-lactamase class C family)
MTEADLAAQLQHHAARLSIPGAAIGILRRGETITAGYGVDPVGGQPVAAATTFSLASLTKPAVATVVARLDEAGALSLDGTVASQVPELRAAQWAEEATLRDLLANRSRLPLSFSLEFDFARNDGTDSGALSRLVAQAAAGDQTGAFWSYTNLGWCLLGRAIERATGLEWETAMTEHLLRPAAMEGAFFAGPLRTRAYGPAGTTMLSTVADVLRFAALHLTDPSLARLRSAHAELRIHGWFDAWCLGWGRFDWPGGPVWGWDGVLGEERGVLRLLPEQDGAIFLTAWSAAGRKLYRALFPELLDEWFGLGMPALELRTTPSAAGDLSRYEGVFAWPDWRFEVRAVGDALRIESDDKTVEALPIDARTFLVDAGNADTPTVTFDGVDDDGRPAVLYEMLWGYPRV